MKTTGNGGLYPNQFIFLVAHPGVGKTRTMKEGKHYVEKMPEPFIAPISVTFASLVDSLVRSKRHIIRDTGPVEYNSIYVCADELGAFIHKFDNEMIDGLSAFYDPTPYSQTRRTSDLKIKIKSPQLNLICGTTPGNLLNFMPEKAWSQGFTSRLIMVFSDERIIGDDFAEDTITHSADLESDLSVINNLYGQFSITDEYRAAVNHWRQLKEQPVPTHPKLLHYITRRRVHLYKLSMISSIDRSNALILTKEDFNRAMSWLLEAESTMPAIFKSGASTTDGESIEEIVHFVKYQYEKTGKPVSETLITQFAAKRIPIHSVMNVVNILERTGRINCVSQNKLTGLRSFIPADQIEFT